MKNKRTNEARRKKKIAEVKKQIILFKNEMEQLEEVEDVQVSYDFVHLPPGIYKAIFECVFLFVHEKKKKH